MHNRMEITFLSRAQNEAFARVAIAAFVVQLNPTLPEMADIKTAVSEAVTNAIVHGYRGTTGDISICLRLLPERVIYIRVSDKGCGIADVRKAMEPLYTTGNPDERSGLGFAVMQSFMDTIRVTSRPGRGTRVTLSKQLEHRQ